MSHDATNWAIKQRGLKPATKIVLWHLADCHNGHTKLCNPRQDTLAEMCEMSRSTVNEHLSKLVKAGLIKRHPQVCPRTKKQLQTRYSLALDDPSIGLTEADCDGPDEGGNAASGNRTRAQDVVPPASGNRTRPVSEKRAEPCPENGQSRVRNSDTNNPGIEPGRVEVDDAPHAAGEDQDLDLDDEQLWQEVLHIAGHRHGHIPTYWSPATAIRHVGEWRRRLGLTARQIVEVARRERSRFDTPPNGPKAFDGAMKRLAADLSAAPMTPDQPRAAAAPSGHRVSFDLSKFEDEHEHQN